MADPLLGRIFNERFRVTRLIARGGMGKVYVATQEPLGRRVALKVLNPAYTAEQSADFHKRFFFEAAIASRLTHPNTVTLFDYGCSDGTYYMAMEYLDGGSLRQALTQAKWFMPLRAVRIAMQVCRSLREAHGMGVIHRDLKPANIFLLHHGDEHDFVKVLDFGLVKRIVDRDESLTQTGLFLGSPGYMAPEQIRGEAVDARSDVYALGTVLYEMLVGQPPFVRGNGLETMAAHVHEAVPSFAAAQAPQVISNSLEQVVMTALAKAPSARFPTMDALLRALKHEEHQLLAATAAKPVELEESGWTVVTSTGILARPRLSVFGADPNAVTQAFSAEDATQIIAGRATQAVVVPPTVIGVAPVFPVAAKPMPRPTQRIRRLAPILRRMRRWGRPAALVAVMLSCWHVPLADGAKQASPPPGPLVLELTSNPPGAAVYHGNNLLCAATPCAFTWEEPPRNTPLVVRFALPGYEELVLGRILQGDHCRLRAQLAATAENI